MRRWTFLLYGVFGHLLFLASYAYLAGFVGNLLVPKTIDSAPAAGGTAIAVDLLLIALFGVQHSVMARPAFKRIWTKLVPQPIERSTYVLLSCLCLFVLMWQWQGVDVVVWNVNDRLGRAMLWGLFAAGWLMVPAVSLMINHFDLFGTRQVWLYFQQRPYSSLAFRVPYLYRYVRHPLYIGWALAFWATPTMTFGHLIFATAMTFYMAAASLIEERDLVTHFGDLYRSYQQRVPRFFPNFHSSDDRAAVIPDLTTVTSSASATNSNISFSGLETSDRDQCRA